MKRQLFSLVGLGLLLATTAVSAQTVALKANIPFNFIVTGSSLPAGEYTIQSLGQSNAAVSISSPDLHAQSMVMPNACESTQASEKTKLVFHRYGDQYFLTQIWMAGENRGRELPRSTRETEVARNYPVQSVVLAATLR